MIKFIKLWLFVSFILGTEWPVMAQTDLEHSMFNEPGHFLALPTFFDDGTMHFRYMTHEELVASSPKTSPSVPWDYEASFPIGPFMSPWRAQFKWFHQEKTWKYMYAFNTLVNFSTIAWQELILQDDFGTMARFSFGCGGVFPAICVWQRRELDDIWTFGRYHGPVPWYSYNDL